MAEKKVKYTVLRHQQFLEGYRYELRRMLDEPGTYQLAVLKATLSEEKKETLEIRMLDTEETKYRPKMDENGKVEKDEQGNEIQEPYVVKTKTRKEVPVIEMVPKVSLKEIADEIYFFRPLGHQITKQIRGFVKVIEEMETVRASPAEPAKKKPAKKKPAKKKSAAKKPAAQTKGK